MCLPSVETGEVRSKISSAGQSGLCGRYDQQGLIRGEEQRCI